MSDGDAQPRRRRRPPQPQPQQSSAIKGAILVAVAVVIGLVLLRDDGASTGQLAVGAADDPAVDTGDTTTTAPTTTTSPARAPAEVKVLVANGSSVNGAAGSQTTELEALGYVTASPTNAERVQQSVVYFTEGYQAEAEALAESIGLAPESTAALPTPAPVGDMQQSNLLLVVGPDLATAG